eukprot:NODE_1314_length_1554_cov_36.129643_g1242_i0.p1 GENE.NODE_1314_length_1554_cov_36.129643_g1242_i0~~NODE_1314_length_1554_cov_36.129643_g1242_i0.p1  ORF type:complete len:484 (-),score=129.49 NODE_1314_length_1554_cov_36.129643_g1242_i0:34-1485(-)
MEPTMVIEGWLQKQGRGLWGGALKRRYCVLMSNAYLEFYQEAKEAPQSSAASPGHRGGWISRHQVPTAHGVWKLEILDEGDQLKMPASVSEHTKGDSRPTHGIPKTIDLRKSIITGLPDNKISITSQEHTRILVTSDIEQYRDWLQALQQVSSRYALGLEDFELLQCVGEGAFGKVFTVTLKPTGSTYAMKVVEKRSLRSPSMVTDILRELHYMQSFNHPFIVKVHCAFQTEDRLHIVMDFLSGGEAFVILQTESFPEEVVRVYTIQLALALEYIHSHGIVYGDMKPENCVLNDQGNMVITDFGVSKVVHSTPDRDKLSGSLPYLPPEVLRKEPYAPAMDWWALGLLVFEFIARKHPFMTPDFKLDGEAVLGDKPNLKSTRAVSEEAVDLVQGLLAKDPTKRLAFAHTLREHPFFHDIDWRLVYSRKVRPTLNGQLWLPTAKRKFASGPAPPLRVKSLKPRMAMTLNSFDFVGAEILASLPQS